MADQTRDRIVIGVDFGTTFSGVAEAYSATPTVADEIRVIKTWPGGNNITSDKVPSEIAYGDAAKQSSSSTNVQTVEDDDNTWLLLSDNASDESLGTANAFALSDLGSAPEDIPRHSSGNATVRWGFQLRPDEPRLRCMKLFLDPQQQTPSFVSKSEMQNQLQKAKKDATTVVADYLTEVYKHTMAELIKRYGSLFIQTTELQWILTVPAVWSDAAKDATLQAAKQAGMGPELTLISEPEAAAVYTLQAVQPNHLKPGDSFIVCDAGGGTVDLISYEIKQARPLRIEESVEGSGACCGAVLLNLNFEQKVRSRMGDSEFNQLCQNKPRAWQTALKYFEEYVKRNVDPTDRQDFNIPFPGAADNEAAGIEQGFLTLTWAEVLSIMRPIIAETIGLVDSQMSKLRANGKSVAGIILVGGFGQSRCLYKALQVHYAPLAEGSAKHSTRFDVLQPMNAWTAVVRGAVLRGLEGVEIVTSRKSRRHYGVRVSSPFDASVHPYSCKKWDPLEEEWRAQNRIKWYLRKGETVSSNEPVLFDFYRDFESGDNRTVTEKLLIYDDNDAPNGYGDGSKSSVRILCKMVVNLAGVPSHLWEEHSTSRGRAYKRLNYTLGMQVESGGLRFDMRVDGVVYGNVTATFD